YSWWRRGVVPGCGPVRGNRRAGPRGHATVDMRTRVGLCRSCVRSIFTDRGRFGPRAPAWLSGGGDVRAVASRRGCCCFRAGGGVRVVRGGRPGHGRPDRTPGMEGDGVAGRGHRGRGGRGPGHGTGRLPLVAGPVRAPRLVRVVGGGTCSFGLGSTGR